MRLRVSGSTSLSPQPLPEELLSGNHSKASKPFSTAYSKGAMSAGADIAVWFPMRMRLRSIIDQTTGVCRASSLHRLSTRLHHIVLAPRDGTLNILRRVKSVGNRKTDLGDREQQVSPESFVPYRALLRVIEYNLARRFQRDAVIESRPRIAG